VLSPLSFVLDGEEQLDLALDDLAGLEGAFCAFILVKLN
jgi:hypothetical protein